VLTIVLNNKTFRVFVSSTFSDLKEERNALQREVFPKLRELCMEHGFRFQAIDLRWGVSEEAGLDQQTMKICLEEIERSQRVSPKPNFIVLLGDRYGWRPLPYEIPADEFEEILDKVPEKDKPFLSWKGDLLDDEQLKKREGWYCLDTNAMDPVYCLKPRFVDYDENDSDDVLKEAKDKESEDWGKIEERIKNLLLKGIEELEWSENDPRRSKYEDSATEQEIMQGVLKPPEDIPRPEEHVFCFFREIEDKRSITYNEDSVNFLNFNESKEIDELSAKKLELLKEEIRKKLPEKNIISFPTSWNGNSVKTNHLDDLCRDVYLSLACTIMKQIEEYEEKDPLDLEIEAHKEFGKERCKFFIGREENLDKIKNYLGTPNSKPMIVYGESGSGKSALMAKAIEDSSPDFYGIKEEDYIYKDEFIARFIGATPESSDLRSLLESLIKQITKIYHRDDSNIPTEYNDLIQDFKERLNFATAEKPLFIFLDALDQLSDSDSAHNFTWIPDELPENVNIILSTLKEPFQSYIENRIPNDNSDEVLKLDEGKELIESWLNDVGRKLTDEQENEVISKFEANGLPLYLKLAFEEAKNWKSYSPVPELKPDIPGIIHFMFERLSRPENHGEILVSHSLGYLSAAKNGLTEDEVLDILALDDEVFNLTKKFHEPTEEKLPVAIWSRLYFDLEPYLTERSADETTLLVFYHRQLGEVAGEKYLDNTVKKSRHQLIAKYFYKQDLYFEKDEERTYNVRKVSELPYQETYGEQWNNLEETLTNLHFVDAKCTVGRTYELIRDYNLALDMHPDSWKEKKKRLQHKDRLNKYIEDLIDYSEGKIKQLDIIPSVKLWTKEEIKKDTERIINNPEQLDIIKAFSQFLNSQSYALAEYGTIPGLTIQEAYNYADSGPVTKNAENVINETQQPLILRDKNWRLEYNPHPLLLKILNHPDPVFDVAITADGRKIISGCEDGNVRVWDLKTGEKLMTLEGQLSQNPVAVTADNAKIISSNKNGDIQVWDLKTGLKLGAIEIQAGAVKKIDVTTDGKKIISHAGYVNSWDLKTGKKLFTIDKIVDTFAVARNGEKIIYSYNVMNDFGILNVWDLKTKKAKGLDESGIVISLDVTGDNKKLISATSYEVVCWDIDTGKKLMTLKGQLSQNTVAVTADNAKIISSNENGVQSWNIFTFLDLNTVSVTPDGKKIISGSKDGTVRVWDIEKGYQKTLKEHQELINAVAVTPDGKKIISGSKDGTVRVWDIEKGYQKTLKEHQELINAVAVTPDGKKIISKRLENSNDLHVIDLKTGKKIVTFPQRKIWTSIPFGRKKIIKNNDTAIIGDKKFICGNKDNAVQVWDIKTGKKLKTLKPTGFVEKIDITTDKKKIIILSRGTLQIWDIESAKTLITLQTSMNIAIACSPNGEKIITKTYDGNLQIWDIETEQIIKTIQKNINSNVIFSADKKKIIILSKDNLQIWDIETGKIIKTTQTNMNNIIACSPNGEKIITKTYNGKLQIWDIETGKIIKTTQTNIDSNVVFSADGNKIIIQNSRNLLVYDLETCEKINTIQPSIYSKKFDLTTDGKKVITISEIFDDYPGEFWEFWDIKTGKNLKKERIYGKQYIGVTADGEKIIARENYGLDVLDVLEVLEKKPFKEIKTLETSITNFDVTVDGKKIVGCSFHNIKIWDLMTGNTLKTIRTPDRTEIVKVTIDGEKIISISNDNSHKVSILQIRDIETGKLLKSLELDVTTKILTLTPDGKKIITNKRDGSLLVLNLETGSLNSLIGHKGSICSVVVTQDGKKIISGSKDGTVRVWDIESYTMITLIKEKYIIEYLAINADGSFLSDSVGGAAFSHLFNVSLSEPLITAIHICHNKEKNWLLGNIYGDSVIEADCPWCGKRFKVTNEIIEIIMEIEIKYKKSNGWIADEAWEDPRLISECPKCSKEIKFNPFIVGNKPKKSRWKFWK
jgi:WD40 repeat protein